MAISVTIPVKSFPLITYNVFNAVYNTPVANGTYQWNIAANQNVPILDLYANSAYIIERVNFSLNIPVDSFQSNLVPNLEPRIQLSLESTPGKQIFQQRQPFITYLNNFSILQYFMTGQADDRLLASFTGALYQDGSIAGKNDINALVQFNIYRVTSVAWVKKYIDQQENLGDNLSTMGRRLRPSHWNNGRL